MHCTKFLFVRSKNILGKLFIQIARKPPSFMAGISAQEVSDSLLFGWFTIPIIYTVISNSMPRDSLPPSDKPVLHTCVNRGFKPSKRAWEKLNEISVWISWSANLRPPKLFCSTQKCTYRNESRTVLYRDSNHFLVMVRRSLAGYWEWIKWRLSYY